MRLLMILIMILPLWTSCTTRQVEPTRSSRRAIDTIFQKQVLALQPQFDSICMSRMDSFFLSAVDSMMMERRAEMIQLVQ